MTVELAVVALAVTAGALLKGITGMGLPPIAIPVLAVLVGVEEAIVIIAPSTALTNGWLVWRHRHHWSRTQNLTTLLVTTAAAGVGGAWLLTRLDEQILAVALVVLVVAYIGARVARPDLAIPPRVARLTAGPVGALAGGLQGATGLSGPVLATYLHACCLPQAAFVLSLTSLFLVGAVAQVGVLAWLGRFDGMTLLASALASALALAVLPIGARLAPRLSAATFDRLVLVALALSAVGLVYEIL